MSSIDFQWTKTIIVWFCMTGYTYSVFIKKEISCYVCSPPQISEIILEKEFYNTFSSEEVERIPTCGSTEAINFTLKCPAKFQGCVTKLTSKQIILKSCNTLFITDCKVANGIKYCSCVDNLCNNDTTVSIPIPTTTDDEDLDQSTEYGSGSFDWEQYEKLKYLGKKLNTTTAIKNNNINNTSKDNENHSFTKASAVNLFLSRSVNIISFIFVIYRVV